MNCLIFTGGKCPKQQKTAAFTASADYIIAADSGLLAAEQFSLTPDLIIGDFDSLAEKGGHSLEYYLKKYKKSTVERYDSDKDFTDTELAVAAALKKAASTAKESELLITLIGGSGGRIDHTLALRSAFEGELHPDIWLVEQESVFFLGAKKTQKRIRISGLRKSDPVSVFPLQGSARSLRLRSDGLFWSLETVKWTPGSTGTSNRITSEYAKEKRDVVIEADRGNFLVVFPLKKRITAEFF